MSTLTKEKESESKVHRQNVNSFKASLKLLLQITSSSRGSRGKTKILQNVSGGNLTLTSSSKRLFGALSIRKPIIQLLISSAQGHLNTCSDGGLFLISLAIDLILKSMNSEINTKILVEIFEIILADAVDYLNSEGCSLKIKACVSDVNFMSSFVNSIITSKPGCRLNQEQLKLISRLILECFLNGITGTNQLGTTSEKVLIICKDETNVELTSTYPGVLILAPELPKFKEKALNPKNIIKDGKNYIKVAMVTSSLSGDLDEFGDVNYQVDSGIEMDEIVVDELLEFCESLIECEVGLVLCQRVVHPRLKYRWRQAGVIVVDRLGLQPVAYVLKLTGCQPIQCLTTPVPPEYLGQLDDVHHTVLHRQSYLHLIRADNPVSTLVLCHLQEQALQELKDVCSTALASLDQLLYTPYVLYGGGCWQVGLAAYLTKQIDENRATLLDELDCSDSVLTEACQIFTRSLQQTVTNPDSQSAINNRNGHVYHGNLDRDDFHSNSNHSNQALNDLEQPEMFCGCGLKESLPSDSYTSVNITNEQKNICIPDFAVSEPLFLKESLLKRDIVLDSLSVCVNALKTGVITTCSVLRIGQVLENV